MTTYEEFVTRLAAMAISTVTKHYYWGQTPPASLNAADLPSMWVQLPQMDARPLSFGGNVGWTALEAQLVVAVLPTIHATLAEAFQSTVEMMDDVREALEKNRLADSRTTWTIRQSVVALGKSEYWAVVADVRATG